MEKNDGTEAEKRMDDGAGAGEDGAPVRYELAYHLVPTIPEEEVDAAVSLVRGLVERAGFSVVSEERPKRFSLAYEISRGAGGSRERHASSFFGWMVLSGDGGAARAALSGLRTERQVLRFLLSVAPKERERKAPASSVFSRKGRGSAAKGDAKDDAGSESVRKEIDREIEALVAEEK